MNILADLFAIPEFLLYLVVAFILILTIFMPVYVCMIYHQAKETNRLLKEGLRHHEYASKVLNDIKNNTRG